MSKVPQFIQEFWAYKDLLKLLVSRNIKLKYRRSFLGYVWSVLNPVWPPLWIIFFLPYRQATVQPMPILLIGEGVKTSRHVSPVSKSRFFIALLRQ